MVMKIVLVAALVMALGYVMGQECMAGNREKEYRKLLKAIRCKDPQPIPVHLQVPEGIGYYEPRAVMLRQCTGRYCSSFHDRCLPIPGQTENHTYTVYASSRNGLQRECANVTVQEHLACECRCDERPCPSNMVFNRSLCECECISRLEKACNIHRKVYGGVMWSSERCSCVCDNPEDCSYN